MLYSESQEIANIANACERVMRDDSYSERDCKQFLAVIRSQLRELLDISEIENAGHEDEENPRPKLRLLDRGAHD